jgi:hypothetical protein
MIYVDVVIYQPGTGTQNNRKWVLIIIAFYGTSQLLIKSLLAIFHHIKWVLTNCRCLREPLGKGRDVFVNDYWNHSNELYREERKDLNPKA